MHTRRVQTMNRPELISLCETLSVAIRLRWVLHGCSLSTAKLSLPTLYCYTDFVDKGERLSKARRDGEASQFLVVLS